MRSISRKRKMCIPKMNPCVCFSPTLFISEESLTAWPICPNFCPLGLLETAAKIVAQPFLTYLIWSRHLGPVSATTGVRELCSVFFSSTWILMNLELYFISFFFLLQYFIKIYRLALSVGVSPLQCGLQDHKWFQRRLAYSELLKDWQDRLNLALHVPRLPLWTAVFSMKLSSPIARAH